MKKKLPPEGLDVSVALLHLRHGAEDGLGVAEMAKLYEDAGKAINDSMQPMKALGFKKMQYAGAMILLHESMEDSGFVKPWRIMAAHESLRLALKNAGIDEPTDDEIIAHAKSRKPDDEKGNVRILGNFR
jgi:hypothetical protein